MRILRPAQDEGCWGNLFGHRHHIVIPLSSFPRRRGSTALRHSALGHGEDVCCRVFAPTLTLPLRKGEGIFGHAHRLSCESTNPLRHHARYL